MTVSTLRLPCFEGQRIGLFGGSFNPAHEGHVEISTEALKRLELEQVWWLVSPQNPLKDPSETGDFADRLSRARQLVRHPRIKVLDTEKRLAIRTTAQTFRHLEPLFRRAHFVWIMGADSFAGLHRWHDWRDIPNTLPLAVFDRPGWSLKALASPAAQAYAGARIDGSDPVLLASNRAPAWCFLTQPLNHESSTRIRQDGSNA